MALSARISGENYRTYVLMGDGELLEKYELTATKLISVIKNKW